MNSDWGLVGLDGTDWTPSRALASASSWPESIQVVRLGDVAAVRALTAPLSAPLPLVTPANVDLATGAITPRGAVDDEGLVLGEDLRVNDVLVPAHGNRPCVCVSDDVRGLAFRGFLRVRPIEGRVASDWLWGFLSSASGISARMGGAKGAAASRLTASGLSDVRVPIPSIEQASRSELAALLPEPRVLEPEGAALRSSWSFRDLRDGGAWAGDERPEDASVGVALSDLGDLWCGTVDIRQVFACPAPGRFRVLTSRAVRGHREPFEPWSEGGRVTTTASVVFTRTEPFRAKHAPAGMLLTKEVLALDLDLDSRSTRLLASGAGTAGGLASYFTHGEGRRALDSVSAGAVQKHLSLAALRRVRVPERLPASRSESAGASSLAERLEAALRSALE